LFIDPSGHIAEIESQEAEDIVKELQSKYGVEIRRDWGISIISVPAPEPNSTYSGCGWQDGHWSIFELRMMRSTIALMNAQFGGRFTSLIGKVKFAKKPIACGRGCTYGSRSSSSIILDDDPSKPSADYINMDRSYGHIINGKVDFDSWTIVHELGHAWDAHFGWSLSDDLQEYTGGYTNLYGGRLKKRHGYCDPEGRYPGCNDFGYFYGGTPPKGAGPGFNRLEDFAESVTAYMFPAQAQSIVRERYGDPQSEYHDLFYYSDYRLTRRWSYIHKLIHGGYLPGVRDPL
jgi:hypothetical protein